MKLSEFITFFNENLNINNIKDYGTNGLQVDAGCHELSKVGFAVDACMETFEKACEQGCQLLVVHHGLFWGRGLPHLRGIDGDRIRYLMQNGLSLYAAHLPLDVHADWGNNSFIMQKLGAKKVETFGFEGPVACGLYGEVASTTLEGLAGKLGEIIPNQAFNLFPLGKQEVTRIGIVTGGGAFALDECSDLGLDTFLTGEFKHSKFHLAKEQKINVISMGHYSSEVGGVLSLQQVVDTKFELDTVFIPAQTGL